MYFYHLIFLRTLLNLELMQKHLSTYKIALTDDDIDDQDLFQMALAETGIEAELLIYNNGMQLLEALTADNNSLPDIIFLDYNMPCKNAVQCVADIRQHKYLQHIPVIVFTTFISPGEMDKAYEKGASLCIRKPDEFSSLINLIRDIFHNNLTIKPQYNFC